MLKAIEERAQIIADTLSTDGIKLVSLITSMTSELAIIEADIAEREAILKLKFDDTLYKTLTAAKPRLGAIQQLAERLTAEGIQITYTFSNDKTVVEARLEELCNLMRAKKTEEMFALPEDWRQTIHAVFKDIQDFYICVPQDLKDKELYIKIKANEAQSGRLKNAWKIFKNSTRERSSRKSQR